LARKIGEAAQREDRLWEKTCFEFFIKMGTGRSAAYWEFNLSPNGGWNVFSLPGYRQKLKEERAFLAAVFDAGFTGDTAFRDIGRYWCAAPAGIGWAWAAAAYGSECCYSIIAASGELLGDRTSCRPSRLPPPG